MASITENIVSAGLLYDEIKRIFTNIKKMPKARITLTSMNERMSVLRDKFNEVRSLHAKILSMATANDQSKYEYFTSNYYDAYFTKYEEVEQYINDQIEKLTEPEVVNTQQNLPLTLENRLPELELPKFDGTPMNWLAFKDQFEAVVHTRVDIPDIRKLQYLRSCLSGEPERMIESFSITTANYASAWKTLTETYNQQRLIISQVMTKMLDIRQTQYDNLNGLRYMRDTVRVCINALKHFEIDIADQFLVHTLVNKFDSAARLKWESSTSHDATYPNYATFEKFISDRIQTLQVCSVRQNSYKPRASGSHNATTERKSNCPCCNQSNHYLFACPDFKSKDPKDRYKFVTDKKLCLNCFNPKHFSNKCNSQHRCRTCNKLHHTLLHLNSSTHHSRGEKDENNFSEEEEQESVNSSNCINNNTKPNKTTLLATAMVKLRSSEGRELTAHVMLDSGSELSFINESTVQALKLKKKHIDMTITGVGNAASQRAKSLVNFEIISRHNNDSFDMNAVVLSKVSSYKPKKFDIECIPEWKNLQLATEPNISKANIDIIIGVDFLPRILKGVTQVSKDKKLIAQETIFGWVISGSVTSRCDAPYYSIITSYTCDSLNKLLERFWDQEEIPKVTQLSPEDEYCEKLFKETTTRLPTGRFVVKLPWKMDDSTGELGESRRIAECSVDRVEKRLNKDPELKTLYVNFINEYRDLNHMTELTPEQARDPKRVFITHHGVKTTKNGKPKVRVVFNAAAATSTGITLNDKLCSGPKLQLDIAAILLNWRAHKYVFSTDIIKMFRQVLVDKPDRIFQNIVWKKTSIHSSNFKKGYERTF